MIQLEEACSSEPKRLSTMLAPLQGPTRLPLPIWALVSSYLDYPSHLSLILASRFFHHHLPIPSSLRYSHILSEEARLHDELLSSSPDGSHVSRAHLACKHCLTLRPRSQFPLSPSKKSRKCLRCTATGIMADLEGAKKKELIAVEGQDEQDQKRAKRREKKSKNRKKELLLTVKRWGWPKEWEWGFCVDCESWVVVKGWRVSDGEIEGEGKHEDGRWMVRGCKGVEEEERARRDVEMGDVVEVRWRIERKRREAGAEYQAKMELEKRKRVDAREFMMPEEEELAWYFLGLIGKLPAAGWKWEVNWENMVKKELKELSKGALERKG